jgi:hypothetical protein
VDAEADVGGPAVGSDLELRKNRKTVTASACLTGENREVDIKEVSQSPATTKEQESGSKIGEGAPADVGLLLLRRCG